MSRKELFCQLCDLVSIFDEVEKRLVAKRDFALFMLYYKAGSGFSSEHEYLLFELGHEDLLEIAALFGPYELGEDSLSKLPQDWLIAHQDANRELSVEERNKFEIKEEDVTDQNIAEMKEIVYASNDELMTAFKIVWDNNLDDQIRDCGRESLDKAYTEFANTYEADVNSLSIEDFHYLVYSIALEYL